MKFTLIFHKDPEEGYVVEVLELPGCISWGKTISEAKENVKEAIELYLESLERWEIQLPEVKDFIDYVEVNNAILQTGKSYKSTTKVMTAKN